MAHSGPSGHRSRHSRNISTVLSGPALMDVAPRIEMVPNPDFAFPRRPQTAASFAEPSATSFTAQRPVSMQDQRPRTGGFSHRKTVSTLPAFSFNAEDASGLQSDQTPPLTPNEPVPADFSGPESGPFPVASSRHRRTNSEFVGGDSRLGMGKAISSSPNKALLTGPASKQFTHRHRRSVAVSSHDLSTIMVSTDSAPRMDSRLPATSSEATLSPDDTESPSLTPVTDNGLADPFGPPINDSPSRPPSRPRVGFSDNVEYIPRPLSTISSETGSSASTVRGHSVNNSISSVLSLGTPSPPSTRTRASTLETTFEDEPRAKTRSSIELSKRIEKEGGWLRPASSRSVSDTVPTEPTDRTTAVTFAPTDTPTRTHVPNTFEQTIGLDRRRSETSVAMYSHAAHQPSVDSESRPSLPRPLSEHSGSYIVEKSSKQKKMKDWKGWAKSKITRKHKDFARGYAEESASVSSIEITSSESTSELSTSSLVQAAEITTAETDLDVVFGSQASPTQTKASPYHEVSFGSLESEQQASTSKSRDSDEYNYMLDLDAALGPFKTPHSLSPPSQNRPIREMHSSRLTKDFGGPGGHYYPDSVHRRTRSTPTGKLDQVLFTQGLDRMQDVFEEEEEEEEEDETKAQALRPTSSQSIQEEESGVGVQIVDSELPTDRSPLNLGLDTDIRMLQGSWELDRPITSYELAGSRLSTPLMERRASSIIEETILEEPSPVEPIEIVEAYEEPRASSFTKSSDSSETPTILGGQPGMSDCAAGMEHAISGTPQVSAFSTPDLSRRQGSFDNSRVGTAASSIADSRTMSSCTTGEPALEVRMSVDDVPSLTSSRSTMLSTFQANSSRRDINGVPTPSVYSGAPDIVTATEERRRKRASIQSLSQLMGGPFGGPRINTADDGRPQTANDATLANGVRKKDNRLKKLMFWKSKTRQASSSTTLTT